MKPELKEKVKQILDPHLDEKEILRLAVQIWFEGYIAGIYFALEISNAGKEDQHKDSESEA